MWSMGQFFSVLLILAQQNAISDAKLAVQIKSGHHHLTALDNKNEWPAVVESFYE